TIEYLIHAGDNAVRLYASSEAAEHYSHALNLIDKIPDSERPDRVLTLYQKRGAANVALGHFQQAVEDYTEMLKQARALGSPVQESAALNALTMTLFYSHRLDEITERADEILRAAERAGSEALRIEAMQVLALKSLGYGEVAKARSMLDEIIRGARALNHKTVLLVGLAWRGVLHFFQTEYEAAETMLLEARSLAMELRDSFLLLDSYFVLGMARGNQGRISEALSTLGEGMELAARYGDHFWSPRMPNCIGWIYREMQDFERAIKYDMKGFDVGREHNVLEAQANSLINLGIDYNRSGESIKTLALFHEVERIFQRDAWFRWRYNIRLQAGKCEDALGRGDIETAYEYAKRLLEIATEYEAHKYVAVAHHLLAQIAVARGNLSEAEAELDSALAELRAYPVPIVEWRVLSTAGRLRAERGDDRGAREAFAGALDIINKIAANVEDEELRKTFLSSPPVREVMAGATRTAS
ncbi:MAG TPA: hypothetical protein VNO14_03240, partial [Blastocatellia bacterium]|nr:hypothetical protein [Blastocatellia bacterium]